MRPTNCMPSLTGSLLLTVSVCSCLELTDSCGRYDPILGDLEPTIESTDQGTSDNTPQTVEVFLEVPQSIETTNLSERDSVKKLKRTTKKFRPFSTKLYNEILHETTSSEHTYKKESNSDFTIFKLPISDQYDPEGEKIDSRHTGQRINEKIRRIKTETQGEGCIKSESFKTDTENKLNNEREDLKIAARKIITESLEKAVLATEEVVNDINSGLKVDSDILKMHDVSSSSKITGLQEEYVLLEETNDIPKSVKETVQLYETIDRKNEITKESKSEDERKLFLLQEIEESIEQGTVRRKSSIFENKIKCVKDRQIHKFIARKAYLIGSETIISIKRAAESSLSNSLLKTFFLYLTNMMVALTRCIPKETFQFQDQLRKERNEFSTNFIIDHEAIQRRKLSSADIAQLVLGKPKELTERMDTVISEFHSKLHIKDRRAKSCSRVEEVTKGNNSEWLSEMDEEDRERVKKEIKLATLEAARRVLGRRRSYHNLNDIENEKIDGLTYIAIVESHVYTNRNAIFDDYITQLKAQVKNNLEITDVHEKVATECLASQSYKFTNKQKDFREYCMKNEKGVLISKDQFIDEEVDQRIDYVATVTVEHKQMPAAIDILQDEKSLQINKLINERKSITEIESDIKQIRDEIEEKIEIKETEEVPSTPIIEEMERIDKRIQQATVSQTNEVFDKVQNDAVEITEVKEESPIVSLESKTLIGAQSVGVETIEEVTVLDNIEDGLLITELKEETPIMITEEEKLSNAQILNKESIRQTSEVYSEVDIKDESYNLVEDKSVLTTEAEKMFATKIVNETYIHEEPTFTQVRIDFEVSANSIKEEYLLETALATSHGVSCEVTTEYDTIAVAENVEIKEEIAKPMIERKELTNTQAISIATTRQSSDIYDEIQNFTITDVTKELPTITLEENLTKPVVYGKDVSRQISTVFNVLEVNDEIENHLIKEQAAEVIEKDEFVSAKTINYSKTEEIHILFNQLDIESFSINENQEFATVSIEIQEYDKIQPICNALVSQINIEFEESDYFDTKLTSELVQSQSFEVIEEVVRLYSICYAIMQDITTNVEDIAELTIKKIDEEAATTSLEVQDFYTSISCCTSVVTNIITNLYEVKQFDIQHVEGEVANESIDVNVFFNAQSKYIETLQDMIIPIENVEEMNIDIAPSEVALAKEEERILTTTFPVVTPFLTQLTIIFTEVNVIENEIIAKEQAAYEEEKRDFYLSQAICCHICHNIEVTLEEHNSFVVDKLIEELATSCVEPQVFEKTLSICTSTLNQITTIYSETETLPDEYFQEENAEVAEEKNIYTIALGILIEMNQEIELILEESEEFIIEEDVEEFAETQIEPRVFTTALSVCTSTLNQTTTGYYETETLPDEYFQEERAESSEEENIYTMTLGICNQSCQDIHLLLEEGKEFNIDKVEEVFTSISVEPSVLDKALLYSTSSLLYIIQKEDETQVLEIDKLEEAEPNVLIEVSKLMMTLAICIGAMEAIYRELEECKVFEVDKIREESCNFTEELFVLVRVLPLCVPVSGHVNISFNNTEDFDVEVLQEQKAESTVEDNKFTTILCICLDVAETINTVLEEIESFNVDDKIEYQASVHLEPEIFCKTLPMCTASLFTLNLPIHELMHREADIFDHKTVSTSLEINEFLTAQALCQATVKLVDTSFKDVENTSISYEIVEEYAKLSSEAAQLKHAHYAVSMATIKELDFNDDITENYETLLEQENINCVTENRDFTIAETISNATVENEFVNLHLVNYIVSSNFEKDVAVINIEPKHIKNIASAQQTHVNYQNSDKIIKSHKESVSIIDNEQLIDANIVKRVTFQDSVSKSLDIKELEDVAFENVRVIEEPVHSTKINKDSKSIRRKQLNINEVSSVRDTKTIDTQKVSKTSDVIENKSTIIESEPVIENLTESISIDVLKDKESVNNEANVDVSIRRIKAKNHKTNQEMSYNLTLTKPQVIDKSYSETKESLYVKKKKDSKQYHVEEFQDEINLTSYQDVDTGVTIREITDSEEDKDSNEVDTENQSMDVNLKLQKQDVSEDYETATLVKKNKKYKENNSNKEVSAALTIVRKEDILVDKPVLNRYQEENLITRNNYENESEIVTPQSSNVEFESNLRKEIVDQKQINKRVSQSNAESIVSHKKAHKEIIGNEYTRSEIRAFESHINDNIDDKTYVESDNTSSIFQQSSMSSSFDQEFVSTLVNKNSKSLSIETNLKREEIEASEIHNINESSPEIESPVKPPTPLTDEYVFRLVAPLPKSRGTTPIPRETSPQIIEDNKDLDVNKKNLVPTIESVTIERVVYNPPLPTPPTSPVHSPTYTKPGLNGGMRRLPRYIKPGLRGGSDRPPIPKEEILEVRKNLSTLTSDINETLKNIEKYKKLVEILKQQKIEGEGSCKMIEEKELVNKSQTIEAVDTLDNVTEKEISEENNVKEAHIDVSSAETLNEPNDKKEDFVEINLKDKIENATTELQEESPKITKEAEERNKSYNIKEVTSFEEIEKDYEDTGIVELAPETGPENDSNENEQKIENSEDTAPTKTIDSTVIIKEKEDKENEKLEDKVDEISDEEQKAADREVARVTELTIDREIGTSKETSPVVTTPRETDNIIKDAHVMSLTRVLSSHMLREGLSPDCQKMKEQFENRQNILDDTQKTDKDRSWTTFLQKSTQLQSKQKFGHFADVQNKFENQEYFITKLSDSSELRISPKIKPRDFNSSPVPWQERAIADTLGAPNISTKEPELMPGMKPEYFLAIPTGSKGDGDMISTVIPLPYPDEQRNTNNEIKDVLKEERKEDMIAEIINEAVRVVDSLEIEEGMYRKKEQTLHREETVKYQKEKSEPKENTAVEISKKESEKSQNIKEKETKKITNMPAETKGELLVKDKKVEQWNKVWPGPSVCKKFRINFMKYEKPLPPLDHLQHSEVYKLIHNVDQTPPKRVDFLRTAIAEADYRERCRSLSPCPPESSQEQNSTFLQFQP